MTLVAAIGAKALVLLYVWLASAIAASYLSNRKGYGEKAGLVSGIVVSFIAPIVWLLIPARADSRWKLQGPIGGGGGKTVAQARAERDAEAGQEKDG